jgi:hypothetical protein
MVARGVIIIGSALLISALALASAVAWGPHGCAFTLPQVIGCALGTYENLSGGLLAADAAIFGGWLAWRAVQTQIASENERARADRNEIERVLTEEVEQYAEALTAVWKLLIRLDEGVSDDATEASLVQGLEWGLDSITSKSWLEPAKEMISGLGWDRRSQYAGLFAALEELRPPLKLNDAGDVDTDELLRNVDNAASYFERVNRETGDYFKDFWRRSPKAMTLGDIILTNAGVEPQ